MQRGRQSVLKIWENVKPATTLRELLQLFALRPKPYSSRGGGWGGMKILNFKLTNYSTEKATTTTKKKGKESHKCTIALISLSSRALK